MGGVWSGEVTAGPGYPAPGSFKAVRLSCQGRQGVHSVERVGLSGQGRVGLLHRQRTAQEAALDGAAAHRDERLELRVVLDTLGGRIVSMIRLASLITAATSSKSPTSRANLSSPARASVSRGVTQDLRRSATSISSRSPARWPRLSSTGLNRSRSRNSTAYDQPA